VPLIPARAWGSSGTGCCPGPSIPQATVQRLQEELEGQQAMLQARAEGEALLKAEIGRLTEENARLAEECLEHRGLAMGLQERLAEAEAGGGPAQVFGPQSLRPHHSP
jgi:septal ring factor EnvC (AmiA/AmiB activator)